MPNSLSPSDTVLLESWQHTNRDGRETLVLPDGCRDLIAWQMPGQAPHWKITALMDSAERVPGASGMRFVGFRLRPGVCIREAELLDSVRHLDPQDEAPLRERLEHFCGLDASVSEALDAIAHETGLEAVRRQLGVSERTLERLLLTGTGRTPLYWRRLARLRQTARQLDSGVGLAQLAADQGYADQAHMNREFRRWLGISPRAVKADTRIGALLAVSGYG